MVLVGMLALTSCKKVKTPEPMGDAGQTIVKFLNGLADTASGYNSGYKVINIDLVSTSQTLAMVDVRRDCANSADLNKQMIVTIKNDPGAATAYNSAFQPLPAGSYTVDASATVVGNDYQIVLEPGQIGKVLKINLLNALALDLNSRYALGFTITTADANGKLAALESSMVVELGVKNRWDGVYKVSGNFFHPTNAALVGPFGTASSGGDLECDLITTGSNSLKRDYGSPVGESIIVYNSSSAGFTYFTGVKMRFAVNATTNQVTVTPADATFISPDPAPYNCTYNPATKTFNLNYGWTSTGGQRVITEVLQYLRPR
ncbi:MAG: hypothetical protein RLY16_524 [Bacteroidota bacterium]